MNNAGINRLNRISSMLGTMGNSMITGMEKNFDEREARNYANYSSAMNEYWYGENGRVATATRNARTSEDMKKAIESVQTDYDAMSEGWDKANLKGIEAFSDGQRKRYFNRYKETTKGNFATLYVRGEQAIQDMVVNKAENAMNTIISTRYKQIAEDPESLSNPNGVMAKFEDAVKNITPETLRNEFGLSGTDDELQSLIDSYIEGNKESWTNNAYMYKYQIQNSAIQTEFSNSLTSEYLVNHSPDTFDVDGKSAYAKTKADYDSRYSSTNMGIADYSGAFASNTKQGDLTMFSMASSSFAYNLADYANKHNLTAEGMYNFAKKWSRAFLRETSLSKDEQEIAVEDFINSIFSSDHKMKADSELAKGVNDMVAKASDKLTNFELEHPINTDLNAEVDYNGLMDAFKDAGFDPTNPLDLNNMATYMSAQAGFTINPSDLQFGDALINDMDIISSAPFESTDAFRTTYNTTEGATEYNEADSFMDRVSDSVAMNPNGFGSGEFSTPYGTTIDEAYDRWLEKHKDEYGEGSAELKNRFAYAYNNAINSGQFRLSSTTKSELMAYAKQDGVTYDDFDNYVRNLYNSGAIKSKVALQQAYALAPSKNYTSQSNSTIGFIRSTLKSRNGGDDAIASFYLDDFSNYITVKRAVDEILDTCQGNMDSNTYTQLVNNLCDNLFTSYTVDFTSSQFSDYISSATGYVGNEQKINSALDTDDQLLYYNYKNGNYKGVVDNSLVNMAFSSIASGNADYDSVLEAVFKSKYGYVNGGYSNGSSGQQSNVKLAVKIASMKYEEERRVNAIFSDQFGGSPLTVSVKNGAYAFVFPNGAVVMQEGSGTNNYILGQIDTSRISPDDYDPKKALTERYLASLDIKQDLTGIKTFSRSVVSGEPGKVVYTDDDYAEQAGKKNARPAGNAKLDAELNRETTMEYMPITSDPQFINAYIMLGITTKSSSIKTIKGR